MKVSRGYSDENLLYAIETKQDINTAIDYIYREHYGMLKHYVLTNSGKEEDAEDIVQEVLVVFIDLIQKKRFRGEASVKSFLYTITRNLWITELRKRAGSMRRNMSFEKENIKMEEDVSKQFMYYESQKSILTLFETLGEGCKKILTLFYYDEKPIKDILLETHYENEQVLRNKKYKCLKELTDKVKNSPSIYASLKEALQHGK